MNTRTILAAIITAAAAAAIPSVAHAQSGGYQTLDCPNLIARTEASRNIPRGLLMAIAVTESALNGQPDPYAMNIAGRGYHATGFQDMTNVISANWQRGVKSIDVGCMQINLKYHGSKFPRMTDLLDPTTNVNYGASFLITLATEAGSWKDAVMSYHNKTNPGRRAWYGCKVWNNYLRITGSSTGFLACASTPGGSSTASVGSTAPIRLAGYNTSRGPGPLTPPTMGASGMQTAQLAMIGSRVVDVPIPSARPQGTLTIVRDGDNMPDVVADDARASAFNAVRPINWAGRVQRVKAPDAVAPTRASSGDDADLMTAPAAAGNGFGRVNRSSDN